MDKLKSSLKHLFAPAIVLLLVAIMGVFSPIVSVAAALRVNAMATIGVQGHEDCVIANLPARTVEVNTEITAPKFESGSGTVKVCHAGKEIAVAGTYKYNEVGQYEWRFYTGDTLFETYTVTVTDTTYAMTMPDNVATVAPKDLDKLTLPLPATYRVGSETLEIEEITGLTDADGKKYATLKVKGSESAEYVLRANVALENRTIANDKITLDRNGLVIDLSDNESTGILKVTYQLYNNSNNKLLVALPLSDIEIKNVTKSQITFANIPTAPSVKNLAYYNNISLTAPSADSAKFGTTSFNVEAQTVIYKVQCYLYNAEPKNWSDAKVHNLTVEKTTDGKWVVKENNEITDKYLEIDGLNVKVKALGWYRFQFQTSTLFGYQLDKDFKADNVSIEQDANKSYVRYWSDSIRIYRDSIEPSFAWVDNYNAADEEVINKLNKDYNDLPDYSAYLPLTEKPDASTTQKITVDADKGLVLPAIFPHDNATPFDKMKVTTFNIEQIQDVNGDSVSNNYVWSTDKEDETSTYFVYDQTKRLQITFVNDEASRGTQSNNNLTLYKRAGLYRIRIVVEEDQPLFEDNTKYSAGYANTKTKYLYFYIDDNFECNVGDTNSPLIDESNVFQVSDVYLWEGSTFDFRVPTYSDNHTPADNIQIDYYLVSASASETKVLSKLDVESYVSRVTVDLNNLYEFDKANNKNKKDKLELGDLDTTAKFYIYAVARNFNGMQANLVADTGVVEYDPNVVYDEYFTTNLFTSKYKNDDEKAQYGYAWKRAAFAIHDIDESSATASIDVNFDTNTYTAGKAIKIQDITTDWGTNPVDGQMSAAVYLVKENNVRVPVNIVNEDDTIVSSVAFNRPNYKVENWSFTPGVGGKYILVVTAKDHASNKIATRIETINVKSSGDFNVTPLSLAPAAVTNYTVDKTIGLGETLVLPNWVISMDGEDSTAEKYFAKNRTVYAYDNGEITDTKVGNYIVTVFGVNDPNCMIGNKFVPNKTGQYIFQFRFELTDGTLLKIVDYVVQVSNETSGVSSIRMGEDYNNIVDGVLWNVKPTVVAEGEEIDENKELAINGKKYQLGAKVFDKENNADTDQVTGTEKMPAYAITLPEFTASNYGAATDFVVDSASLFDYLEPIYDGEKITGYMYPAIAIPMPNVVTDTISSDEVEITVQKSGSSNYLVSSKKLNAGGSSNKASVIGVIDGYYVFRPDGKFSSDCKTKYDAQTYPQSAPSPSSVAGVYTVAYKTNNTSVSFNLTFGNLKNGNLAWNAGFLTYDNNDGKGAQEIANSDSSAVKVVIEKVNGHRYVTIDLSKVYFNGNEDMEDLIAKGPDADKTYPSKEVAEREYLWENVSVTVSFEGSPFINYNDWSDKDDKTEAIKIHGDNDGNGYKYIKKFDLTQGSGTYKVNISMPNRYTASTVSKSIEFTIDVDATNKNHNLNNVWGIILVVLSLGLLAGVIFYFVKTARATRFVDVPRAVKGKDKDKTKAPKAKAVEAPKEDVK